MAVGGRRSERYVAEMTPSPETAGDPGSSSHRQRIDALPRPAVALFALLAVAGVSVASATLLLHPDEPLSPNSRLLSSMVRAPSSGVTTTCATFRPTRVDRRMEVDIEQSHLEVDEDGAVTADLVVRNVDRRGVPSVQYVVLYVLRPGTDAVVGGSRVRDVDPETATLLGGVTVRPLPPGGSSRRRVSVSPSACGLSYVGIGPTSGEGPSVALVPGRYDVVPVATIVQQSSGAIYASVVGSRRSLLVKTNVAAPVSPAPQAPGPCRAEDGFLAVRDVTPTDVPAPHPSPPPPAVLDFEVVAVHLSGRPCRMRADALVHITSTRDGRSKGLAAQRADATATFPEDHLRVLSRWRWAPACSQRSDGVVTVDLRQAAQLTSTIYVDRLSCLPGDEPRRLRRTLTT